MRRTPLSGLVLSVVLPLMLVSLVSCTQLSVEEKKAKHYERGMAYFKGEKFQEAVIEFKNIIQLDPKDANAYYQLALSHIKLGGLSDLQAAFGELMKTVEIDPTIQDAQLKLGEFYLLSRKPKEAIKHANIVLTASPQEPKGHLLRGRSLIVGEEFEEGIRELHKTLELDPDNEHIYLDLAKAYLGMKKPREAEGIIEQGLEQNSTSVMLILAKGDVLLAQDKRPEAEVQFHRAMKLDADNDELYRKFGQYFLSTQQWKKAEEVYLQFATQKPKGEAPQLLLGEYYTFLGVGSKALEHFKKAVILNPESRPAQHAMTNFYLDNRKWDDAETLVSAALKENKKDLIAQVFQGRLLLGQGKADEAIPLFQRVIKEEPNQAMAHQYLGVAFATKKDISQALQELNEAVKLAPQDRGIRKALSLVRMAEGSYGMAIEEAQTAIRLNARDVQAVHLLGQAYLKQKNVAQAKKVYQSIVKQIPQDAIAQFQLGVIDRQDKKPESAIVHFEAAMTHNPRFVQALGQISSIHVSRGEAVQARERVQQQIEVVPDDPFLYNLLGGLWMQANETDNAEQAFKKSLALNDQLQVSYMNLAELYRRTQRTDEAVQEYERLLEKNPKVASAHMILGMIAEQGKDIQKAQIHYRKTLDIEPQFSPAANNLAWLMSEHEGNLDEALSLAESARGHQEDNPHIADTLGWIYYKKSAYLKAVSLLQEAAAQLPENPVVQYHLGMAQFKNGDRLKGKESLNAAFQLSQNFPGADEAKATLGML